MDGCQLSIFFITFSHFFIINEEPILILTGKKINAIERFIKSLRGATEVVHM